jgi:hypothetical protein
MANEANKPSEREFLQDGQPRLRNEIYDAALRVVHSQRTIERAADTLPIDKTKETRKGGRSLWILNTEKPTEPQS